MSCNIFHSFAPTSFDLYLYADIHFKYFGLANRYNLYLFTYFRISMSATPNDSMNCMLCLQLLLFSHVAPSSVWCSGGSSVATRWGGCPVYMSRAVHSVWWPKASE